MKRIIIGADHAGFRLKEQLKTYLEKKGFRVRDVGTYSSKRCDYPLIAYELAKNISQGRYKSGILICRSGIGNSIVANKLSNVRAALCYNVKAARLSREHNDSNVLILGASFINEKTAKRIVSTWLNASFMGGRHKRRLNQIRRIEREICRHNI